MFDDWSIGADYGDYGPSTIDVGSYTPDYSSGMSYDFTPEAGGIVDTMAQNYNYSPDYGGILAQTDGGSTLNNWSTAGDTGNVFGVNPSIGSGYENAGPSTVDAVGNPYGSTPAPGGIQDIVSKLGDKASSKDTSWADKAVKAGKSVFTNKEGDLDLIKVMTAIKGLGGLYAAYKSNKNNPNANKTLTPTELAATLPQQNNQQWTPQQQIWANKFFNESIPGVAEGDRRVQRAGEGGIKSIIPSRGYAEGGGVEAPTDITALLKQLYEQQDDGVVPLLPKLGLPQQGARIRIHGGDMADGGEVPMDQSMGPLSHGTYGLVSGEGDGQGDMVPINASPGEYVFDAETVSMLGNGSNDAGADILDKWREFLREHKRSASPDEIGPPSNDPNSYLPDNQGEE
jgi:hypothetical protein